MAYDMQFYRVVVPWLVACISLICALTRPAHAEVGAAAREAARIEYERGLELAKHGDYTTALSAFRAAYAASPHFLVLYNIAQAEVALGRPIPAAEALSRYLDEGGTRVLPARRKQVATQLEWLRSRFAELSLAGAKPDARILVDGSESEPASLAQPLRLSPGAHRISVLEPGVPPLDYVVTLMGGERQVLRLDTVPPETGTLVVECAETGAELLVDGLPVDWQRATQGLVMGAGRHRAAFSAPGQRWMERTFEVRAGENGKLSCPTAASLTGTLAATCVEPDTTVVLDGRPLPLARVEAGVEVSAGRHTISFRAPGRRFREQSLDMPGAAALMVWCGSPEMVGTVPEPPLENDREGDATMGFTQTHAGLVTGGAGLLLGAAAGGHYLWNRGRHADWRTEDAALTGPGAVPDYRERQLANNALADSIERGSRVSVGLAVASGALVSAGIVLIALDGRVAPAGTGRKNAWERIVFHVGGLRGSETTLFYSGHFP